MLSHTAWNCKESGAAAAVVASIAICRYGSCSSAGLGRLMSGGGGSGVAASSGGEFQTARQGFVLIFFYMVRACFLHDM